MGLIFYLLLTLGSFVLYNWIYLQFFAEKEHIHERLNDIAFVKEEILDEKQLSFKERVIEPIYEKVFIYFQSITPSAIKNEYEKSINLSGMRSQLTPTNLLLIQILAMILAVLTSLFLIGGENVFLVTISMGATFLYLPVGVLRLKGKKRQAEILYSLPTFLDLVYVTVEAGLSFDLALKNTLERLDGPLAEEFKRTLEEITHGRNRSEAFHDLGNRTQIEEIQNFITSIILAEEMGSNIGNVLRVQSETIRKKRKQRAEQAAAKIPVKMTFPLVLLMFPALFIVILGPAVISIIESLG